MKKILKRWGEGLGVYFNKEDINIFEIQEGDIIDMDDILIHKIERRKNKYGIRKQEQEQES